MAANDQIILQGKVEEALGFLKEKQFDQALEKFNALLDDKPASPLFNFYKGVALAESGQEAEAAAYFARVKDPTAQWFRLGILAVNMKFEPERSIGYFDRVLKLNPGISAAWFNKALLLEKTGRFVEAREAYKRISLRRDILIRMVLPFISLVLAGIIVWGTFQGWMFANASEFVRLFVPFIFVVIFISSLRSLMGGTQTIRMIYRKQSGKLEGEA